jgi:hypothetical protein
MLRVLILLAVALLCLVVRIVGGFVSARLFGPSILGGALPPDGPDRIGALPPPERDTRVLPKPNGYDVFHRIASRLPDLDSASPLRAGKPDRTSLRRAIAEESGVLEELRRSFKLRYLTPAGTSSDELFDQMRPLRAAVRAFATWSRAAREGRRPDYGIANALDAVELGSRVPRGAGVVGAVLGFSFARTGVDAAEPCVANLSSAEAHRAGRRLDAIIAAWPPAAATLREERPLALAELRRVHDDALRRHPRPQLPQSRTVARFLRGAGLDLWRGSYDELERCFPYLLAESSKPYSQRRDFTPRRFRDVVDHFRPEGPSLWEGSGRNQALLRLLRLELAIREYSLVHGAPPATLSQLSPAILRGVPVDPFTGQPFPYRRTPGGYLLYSVGPDGKDDRATPLPIDTTGPAAKGDLVAGKLLLTPRKIRQDPAKTGNPGSPITELRLF